ncbi:MAG: nuclear transport factor 2 family protein [Novosphingobium sp.]|nr:nuclear transport factor 2 family protein [Novosphingobium sp.]
MSSARDEIVRLVNRYDFAVDTRRWELFDRIFTTDVEADFSAAAHRRDRPQFKTDFAAFHDPFDSTQHIMANHLVSVDGDVAQAFTYGSCRLVRTGLGWRIRKRVCRVVWFTGNPFVNETIAGVKFELDCQVLRREGDAGRVGYLQALRLD